MLRLTQGRVGDTADLGWVIADAATVAGYWRAIGLSDSPSRSELPLGLALALRGRPRPEVDLEPGTLSVHAGHVLTRHRPFVADRRYRLLARISEVFEKNGRSGPLTVIVRESQLRDEDDAPVVALREDQIARRLATPPTPRPLGSVQPATTLRPAGRPDIDIGATIAVEHRPAPDARSVRAYAASLNGCEPLFTDRGFARRAGFRDVVVPGPLQSALIEDLLTRQLPTWRFVELSLSFRVSIIAGEPITMSAVVIEIDDAGRRLVVDLTIENSHAERAAVGSATLTLSE